jgi:hypothetical protein
MNTKAKPAGWITLNPASGGTHFSFMRFDITPKQYSFNQIKYPVLKEQGIFPKAI